METSIKSTYNLTLFKRSHEWTQNSYTGIADN